jgi:hypothetical protein
MVASGNGFLLDLQIIFYVNIVKNIYFMRKN